MSSRMTSPRLAPAALFLSLLASVAVAPSVGCDPARCNDSTNCPAATPYCGPSGQCTDIRPPDENPIGDGDPIDKPVDAGTPEDPYEADAGPVACQEDALEDNDVRDAATPATDGVPLEGSVCGDDDDWYSITALSGCSVVASLTQTPAAGTAGDIDMLLFGPDGSLVGTANTPAGPEALNVVATASGRYAVRLRAGSRDNVSYVLTLSSLCTNELVCPADDTAEDNENASQAASLVEGVPWDGIVCGADEDWYTVPVQPGCIADVRVVFNDSEGDIDLHLVGPDGILRERSTGVTDEERITRVVPEAGSTVRVYIIGAGNENTYRLTVDGVCAGQLACPSDDPFEPNDTRSQGSDLFAGTENNDAIDEAVGVVCGNDDFYRIIPQAGCTLRGTLTFADAEGDLDLELVKSSDGTSLDRSAGTMNLEQVEHTPTDTTRLAFRVYGFGSATNAYRLRVETDCP